MNLGDILQSVLDSMEQGVLVLDDQWRVITWSQRYIDILGMPEKSLYVGQTLEDLVRVNVERGDVPNDGTNIEAEIRRYMTQLGADLAQDVPRRYVRQRPNDQFLEVVRRNLPDDGVVFTIADVSERERAFREIERLAWTDPVTGLLNRNSLMKELGKRTGEDARQFALLLVDLDRFKAVNDTYGHSAGDAVLLKTAARIAAALDPDDLAFRQGGDEFVIILDGDRPVDDIDAFAADLVTAVQAPVDYDGRSLSVGASIGAAICPDHDETLEGLLRKADIALYVAKNAGRSQHKTYETVLDEKTRRDRRVEDDLRPALENDQLELHFQPVVKAKTGKIVGAEALIRWRHPESGLLLPQDFIPVLERSDLVLDAGISVLWKGWLQLEKWSRDFADQAVTISVNVSARQLFDHRFLELLEDLAMRNKALAHRLELEITESLSIHDIDAVVDLIARIDELGFPIVLDDFGMGFSSISYLATLPIQKLKIDRSFLPNADLTTNARMVLTSIINLGHGLGLKITAVGVEHQAQAEFLQERGCNYLQGYLFGSPMEPDVFETLLGPGQISQAR